VIALVHDCFVCRLLERTKDLPRGDLFTVAYATGYAEGATTAADTIEWTPTSACAHHTERLRLAALGVMKAIKGTG
jgi:hypothetical protein